MRLHGIFCLTIFLYFALIDFNRKGAFIIMKKFLILIFSLFITGVCYAENCSQSGDCWSAAYPTSLICSPSVQVTTSGTCRFLCTTNASFDGVDECRCDAGFGGNGSTYCNQCTAGTYGPNASNACVNCPTAGGITGTSAAGSDVITDCYKSCTASTDCPVTGGYFIGTCHYSTGTSLYLNIVTGTCDLTCNPGYHVSGSSCVANTINISYNAGGGIGSAPSSPTSFVYGSTTNAPAGTSYSKTGYTFTGWGCTGGITGICSGQTITAGSNIGSVAYSGTITLTAQWSANTINISYDGGGGTGTAPSSPTSFVYDATATAPTNTYSYTDYTFAGWLCSISPGVYCSSTGNDINPSTHIVAEGDSIKNAAASGGIKLTAQWAPDEFLLVVDPNNGNPTSGVTCTIGTPCDFAPTTPTAPSGYTFVDWCDDPFGACSVSYTSPWTFTAFTPTIYARWKKTITFDGNGGTFPPLFPTPREIDCYRGGNLSVPDNSVLNPPSTFHSSGHYWYPNNYGGGIPSYTSNSTPACNTANDTPVYPKWDYTVSYDGNCPTILGGAAVPSATTCTKNSNCTIATIPPAMICAGGYVLDTHRWWVSPSGTGTNYASGSTTFNNATGDITLHAKWILCGTGQWADVSSNTCVDCAEGYFCPAGSTSPTACPAGHTSAALSDAKSDCYMSSGTKFCDDGGARCFHLPAGVTIGWVGP